MEKMKLREGEIVWEMIFISSPDLWDFKDPVSV